MRNSEAIKTIMKETGISQTQLVKYIGVKSQSNVSEAIKNNVKSTMTLLAMAEAMGYEVVLPYEKMKWQLKRGDEVIVKELDRLGRNKEAVKAELQRFKNNGIIVRILDVPTTLLDFQDQEWIADMVNNVLIEVMGAVAEQERIKIRQRQAERIAAARAKGKTWGRFREIPECFAEINQLVDNGNMKVVDAIKQLGVSRRTWYNWKKKCG